MSRLAFFFGYKCLYQKDLPSKAKANPKISIHTERYNSYRIAHQRRLKSRSNPWLDKELPIPANLDRTVWSLEC
jgi:hypothetical protein